MANLVHISYFSPLKSFRIELDNGELHFIPNDHTNPFYIKFQKYIEQPNIAEFQPEDLDPIRLIKNDQTLSYAVRLCQIIEYQKQKPKYVNIKYNDTIYKILIDKYFIELNKAKMIEITQVIEHNKNAALDKQMVFTFTYLNPKPIYTVSTELDNLNFIRSLLYRVEYQLMSENYRRKNEKILQFKDLNLTQEEFEQILQENNDFNDIFISETYFDYTQHAI